MAGSSKPTSIVPGGVGEPAAHDDVEMASATSPQAHSQSGASLPENGKSDETDGENDEAGPSSATLPPPSPRTQRRQQPQFDDPDLLASYPIYLSTSLPVSSKLHLMQYPTYPRKQPLPVPESSRQRGLSQAIRWRPNAGWVQVELPLDLRRSVYDDERGADMGRGALMAGGEIGSTTPADGDDDDDRKKKKKKPKREDDDGDLASKETKRLEKIRLESDLIPNMTRYCVGVMRDQALHLTHLDRVVQLRPSMHHLDGMDAIEAQEKRHQAKLAGAEEESDADGGEAGEAAKDAAAKKKKAMSYNVSYADGSGARGGPGGPGGGGVTEKDQLMASKRLAEAEQWVDLEWRDMNGRRRSEVLGVFSSQLFAGSKTELKCKTKPRDYLP